MEKERIAPVADGEILAGKYRVERVLGVGGMGVGSDLGHRVESPRSVDECINYLLQACEAAAGAITTILLIGGVLVFQTMQPSSPPPVASAPSAAFIPSAAKPLVIETSETVGAPSVTAAVAVSVPRVPTKPKPRSHRVRIGRRVRGSVSVASVCPGSIEPGRGAGALRRG